MLRWFLKRIYVRLPGKDDRVQMLLKLLSKQYNDLSIHEVHQVGRFPNPKLFIELGHRCGVF